ncbi:MAG TPA: undecaprenyl diphosphate synthase family protein [Methanotrichaceae archaeon]|nr:undecaprenyl diphosphate synthase family protein [Methanotrichaceae archaeon]
MLHYLYERLLEVQISQSRLPECVAVVLSSGDLDDQGLGLIRELMDWSDSLGIRSLAVHINDNTPEIYQRIVLLLSEAPAELSLHTREGVKTLGAGGRIKVAISLDYGGKREVTEAIRKLLEGVEAGSVDPEEIDEETIESNLRFSQKPDLVIRAGGNQLSDFMIWQSAYSELYFTEVNWRALRKIDFLRAIRDCQQRNRRFGR